MLEEAIADYGKQILRYCHGILCNYHDAQDAVQMTFIKAHKAGSFDVPLLYRIAYHTCLDLLRKRRRTFFHASSKDSYEMEDKHISEELKNALMSLNAKDRALVLNRVIDEMDYKELAEIYKASPEALRKRYERAKKKLAEHLRGDNENGQG